MELLIIRHAIAEEPVTDDAARRLTDEGRKRMRRAAKRLPALLPAIDLLATSPLIRAVETAEIVAAAYGGIAVVEAPALAPGQPPEALAQWLASRRVTGVVCVVGHEPGLNVTAGWLLAGTPRALLDLKKGAACLLNCPDGAQPGAATLRWSLTPAQLRALRL